jgi:hypothetical protein
MQTMVPDPVLRKSLENGDPRVENNLSRDGRTEEVVNAPVLKGCVAAKGHLCQSNASLGSRGGPDRTWDMGRHKSVSQQWTVVVSANV